MSFRPTILQRFLMKLSREIDLAREDIDNANSNIHHLPGKTYLSYDRGYLDALLAAKSIAENLEKSLSTRRKKNHAINRP